MRKAIVLAMLVVLALGAAQSAAAPCPNMNGIFATTNGTLLAGRASEAWCAGAGPGVPGNTENAESWDGTALGTQWKLWGMSIDASGAVETGRRSFGPYMYIDYATNYTGGQFWLSRNFPWSDGANDLTGVLTSYHVATTVTIYNGQPVGATSNITLTGVFTNCPDLRGCVLEWGIANAIKIWDSTSTQPMPANYPAFLCGATTGELFDACCAQLSINCAVDNEGSSWSGIKSMYR